MTCAVSAAVREGAEAVICASTGNTAASAAAYAARAGLRGAVIVPEGKIAIGKLAQALMHGARVIALRGNFDHALRARARARRHAPDRARELGQRVPDRGAEDGRLRDARGPRRGARRALHPGRQRRQHHRLLARASCEIGAAPRMFGFQAAGRGAARARPARRAPGDGRHRDPDRQPGALGAGDGRDDRLAAARSAPSATSRSSTPTACWRQAKGSSASRPRPPRSRACSSTAPTAPSGSCACSPATGSRTRDTALEHQAAAIIPCEPELSAIERGGAGVSAGRAGVRVPASSANLGPGFDCFAAALGLHLELEVRRDRRASTSQTDLPVARDRRNLAVRAFERLHPADGFASTMRSKIPLAGASARAPPAIVAGLLAADQLFELRRRPAGAGDRDRGPPGQRRRGACCGGFVVCADGQAAPLRAAGGAGGAGGRAAREPVRTAQARAALPAQVPARRRRRQRRARRPAGAGPGHAATST